MPHTKKKGSLLNNDRERYIFGGVASRAARKGIEKIRKALANKERYRGSGVDPLDKFDDDLQDIFFSKDLTEAEYQGIRDELSRDIVKRDIGDWSDAVGDTRFMDDGGRFDSELVDEYIERTLLKEYPEIATLDQKFDTRPVRGGELETDYFIDEQLTQREQMELTPEFADYELGELKGLPRRKKSKRWNFTESN